MQTETEAQGELLAKERIERKAEVDSLRIEIEALKKTLQELLPDFIMRYRSTYKEQIQSYNPDLVSEGNQR